MGAEQVLLGNVEPVGIIQNGTPEEVTRVVTQCHVEAGTRHIVSAGCEIPRATPPENLHAMRHYARTHRP
jgi:uroporphyrinogen-III decarboxylase